MESEGSLPFAQEPAFSTYPELHESRPTFPSYIPNVYIKPFINQSAHPHEHKSTI
jgi:hypothetical protein